MFVKTKTIKYKNKIYSVSFCLYFPIDSARFRAQSGNGAFQSLGGSVLACHTSLFSEDNFRRISRSSSYDINFFYSNKNQTIHVSSKKSFLLILADLFFVTKTYNYVMLQR
jgi:hypothetical protein